MNKLKDLKCPCCNLKHLTEYKHLKEIASEKSLTGYFIVPIAEPIIMCLCCGAEFKSITYNTDTDEVESYDVVSAPIREEGLSYVV